ncbi:MAG: BREX-3 system phosphatase PglZ [Opitutaceae bacterium]
MSTWRDTILKEFPSQVARLTLVADPDGLLTEEGVLQGLRERGFDLIEFEDPIAFRYAYESKYRARWDRGENTDLVVVLRSREQDLRKLPYDLYTAGRKLSFSIPAIFPNLSYPVVEALGAKHFDSLFRAQEQYKPARMGSNQSADFILLHVFETEPKLIQKPAQLLHFLMRKHYRDKVIPSRMVDRFVEVLRQGGHFDDWPLEQIVATSADFYAFIQERWVLRVQSEAAAKGQQVKESKEEGYGLKFPGPTSLPFEHDDVRVYLDNLFSEGLLDPVEWPSPVALADTWLLVGVSKGAVEDRQRRLDHAQSRLAESIPNEGASYQEWMTYARTLGDLRALMHLSVRTGRFPKVMVQWTSYSYPGCLAITGAVCNQPSTPPVMVHHIPKAMSALMSDDHGARLALVVIDGMSMGQWSVIREVLRDQDKSIRFEEQAVFAWIPTLTSVSRQAIFSGKLPQFFPESFYGTSKEGSLWKQFWAERGLDAGAVQHIAALGPSKDQELLTHMEDDRLKVLGVVVNTVDDIMHGMVLGSSGMYSQVEQWARQGYLQTLLKKLVAHGFRVFLTSDHGNIEARGIGNPSEGSTAETRGQRVRIYNSPELRSKIAREMPEASCWPPIGLPPDVLPLLAPTGSAFIKSGVVTVSHGGASIEEAIVPFAAISGDR